MSKEAVYPDFSAESNVWDYFFGDDVSPQEKAKRHGEMDAHAEKLEKLFGSRALWVQYCTHLKHEWEEYQKRGAKKSELLKTLDPKGFVTGSGGLHPHALDLLREYGQQYRPGVIDQKYKLEPRNGKCFLNSYSLMRGLQSAKQKDVLVYVEGLTIGSGAFMMPHAWNAKDLSSRKTLDWTHYAVTRWNKYFGIAFTQAEIDELLILAGHPTHMMSIFSRLHFTPVIEKRVREILARRARG